MISLKLLIILLIIISGLAFAFLTPVNFLINFAHDDSFFYIKTANNFSQGLGSTFDGINLTNGYHPLWFLILASYFFILNFIQDFSPERIFRFVTMLQFLISGLTLYFVSNIFRISNDFSQYGKKYLLFIPLFIILVFSRDFGIESQLTCLIFSIYCYLKSEELFSKKSYTLYKSILLCFLFLSRTDYLFSIIPFIIIFDYYTSEKNRRTRFLILSVFPVLITALSYFLFNKITYGNYLTVSASSKNTFPDFIFIQNINNLVSSAPFFIHFLKSICILIVILFFLFSKKRNDNNLSKMNIFLLGSCLGAFFFILLNYSFNTHALREWYVTFPTFAALLLFIYSSGFSKEYFILKFIILIIFCSVYFYSVRMNNFKWDSSYEYAMNLKKVTDNSDRIFQIDYSGVVGFFSERKLINGDGLINGFEYRNYLTEGRLKEYFKDKNINLYSTHSEEGNKSVTGSEGYYTDKQYSNRFGGYSFIFPEENLFFKMPFYYDHSLSKIKGDWYLFKIPD